MSDVSLGHTFAQVICCLLSNVLYSKHQEAIQPSADHVSCNRKNYLLRKSLSFLAPTSLPGFLCRGGADIFRFISFSTFHLILKKSIFLVGTSSQGAVKNYGGIKQCYFFYNQNNVIYRCLKKFLYNDCKRFRPENISWTLFISEAS